MDKSSFYSYRGDQIRGNLGARRTVVAQRSMLTHSDIWNAVDRLAARAGLSASGLAKKAGLDPTTFNKSKRITPEGRPRWPSTESVSKSLDATGTTVDTFVSLITDRGGASTQAVPLIGLAEAGAGGYFDDGGFPVGKGWDEIAFPAVNDEHAYALEVSGNSMEPAYPSGELRAADRKIARTSAARLVHRHRKNQMRHRERTAHHRVRHLRLEDIGEPLSPRSLVREHGRRLLVLGAAHLAYVDRDA